MPRPTPRFHDFIGQRKVVDLVRRLLEGAQARAEPFPHALLIGPSGVGKTRLARALAAEFKTKLVSCMGYEDRAVIGRRLQDLETGDFLFIDEAHRLRGPVQELLCEAIDRGSVPPIDSKHADPADSRGERVALKPWTLLLATDQPGMLLDALSKRVELEVPLGLYNPKELKEIVDSTAAEKKLLLTPQAAGLVAQVSAGLPRRARHLLKHLGPYFPDSKTRQLGLEDVRKYLSALEYDAAGLSRWEGLYLDVLGDLGGASLESIALALGVDSKYVERQIEPRLVREGFVETTSAGRQLKPRGQAALLGRREAKANDSTEEGDEHDD